MLPEVLLAPIPQPHAQDLGDLLLSRLREPFVEAQGTVPFLSAGSVSVGVPMGPGQANASSRFLYKRFPL